MKKTIFVLLSFCAISSFAKVNVLCEKKRDHNISSICGKSSSAEKRQECISFYKSASCDTVGLHEAANND